MLPNCHIRLVRVIRHSNKAILSGVQCKAHLGLLYSMCAKGIRACNMACTIPLGGYILESLGKLKHRRSQELEG
jgi:hypothetical protein